MKRRGDRFMLIAAALGIIAIVVAVGLGLATERKRQSALEQYRKPASIKRYQKAREPRVIEPTAPELSPQGIPATEAPTDPAARIAAFEAAVAEIAKLRAGDAWRAYEAFRNTKPMSEWTEAEWARAKEAMEEARALIAEIRRLAREGGPVSALDLSKGYVLKAPHLSNLNNFVDILGADARLWAREGNYGEAVEDILAVLGLSATLHDEPLLNSQMARTFLGQQAYETVEEALPAGGLPSELAQRLIEAARQAGYRDSFAEGFQSQAFVGIEVFEQMRNGGADEELVGAGSWTDRLWQQAYGSILGRPFLNMDEETYLDMIGRIEDLVRQPYYEARPALRALEEEISNLPVTRVGSRSQLPPLCRISEEQAAHEARLGLIQIGLALEQYYGQTGSLPATLNPIDSSLGGALPVDPFTGKPYVYKPSGDGFLLYSVGPNLTDDNGRPATGAPDKDIVWRGSNIR